MASPEQALLANPDLPTVDRTASRRVLIASIAGGLLVILQFIRWPLTEIATPFLEPLIELASYFGFAVLLIVCLIRWLRARRTQGPLAALPFAICLVTVVVLFITPFNALYMNANFHLLRSRRTAVAQEVLAGKSGKLVSAGGRGDLIELPEHDSVLSAGGGEIMVDRRDGKTFVLFFTFRGILDSFSGYVYSPTDDPPAKDEFLGLGLEIFRVAPNWYWYAS